MSEKLFTRVTDEELIFVAAGKLRVSPKESAKILDSVFESIRHCLTENETVHMKKFGMLFLKKKKSTSMKNFKGETISQDCWMVRFKPASSVRDFVNQKMRAKLIEKIKDNL